MNWVLVLLGSILFIQSSLCFSSEFTVTVEPGKEDCYYVTVPKNVYLEVDYQVGGLVSQTRFCGVDVRTSTCLSFQVVDGQQGELDIDFQLTSPTGRRIVMETRKSDSTHRCFSDYFTFTVNEILFFLFFQIF